MPELYKILRLGLCGVVSAGLVAACMNNPQHAVIEKQGEAINDQLVTLHDQNPIMDPAVERLSRPPANLTPISTAFDPLWFSERGDISMNNVYFPIAAKTLFASSGVVTTFDNDLDQTRKISIRHQGTLREALEELSIASGYGYTIEGNRVLWHKLVTATIDISSLPGVFSHALGTTEDEIESNDNSDQAEQVVRSKGHEFAFNKGELDVWTDIENVLKSAISEDGNYAVSRSMTALIVQDYPANIRKVRKVIADFNERLSRQVLVQVQVVNVGFNSSRADGIDWNLVRSQTGNTLNFASPLIPNSFGGIAPMILSAAVPETSDSPFAGSELLIQAIQQQATTSSVTQPRAVALNNQVAEIRVNTDTDYLASSKTTITDSVSSTEMIPGVVTDGFTMYVIPKVADDGSIFMQFSTTIAILEEINTITSGDSKIQTPVLSRNKFGNRVRMQPGQTLLLSGFLRKNVSIKDTNNFNTKLLGTRSSEIETLDTVLLITPVRI